MHRGWRRGGHISVTLKTQDGDHDQHICLTDSDEVAVVDFVKDHEELYDKTNEHFKDKARKKYLWDRFTNICKLYVKAYKTWFESQRKHFGKLTQSKSGQAPKEMTGRTGFRMNLTS